MEKTTGKEVVRVLRILEYVGDRAWVENTLKNSSVPCNGTIDVGQGCMIKSATIDQFPEILNNKEPQHEKQDTFEDRKGLS